MRGRSFKTNPYTLRAVVVIMLLLSTLVFFTPQTTSDDFPEEDPPDPPEPPNTRPYLLEPPFPYIEVAEEFEWEGRVAVEDNDTIEWNITHNMTEDDYSEYEWTPDNYSVKLKVKCNRTFQRWFNVSATDNVFDPAYWNWTVYCLGPGTRGDDPGPSLHSSTLDLKPNGEGHELDWTPKSAGDHYVEVDDGNGSEDDDSTYVSIGSGNAEDYWTLTDHTTETATISNVRLSLRVKHSAGGEEFAFALSNGSSEYVGTDVADSTSWTTYYEDHATNPITSGDWYWGDIDYLQLGIKSRAIGGFTGTEYCTAGWITVSYTLVANTDYFWCGSACGGDGYQWDDQNNWRDSATWTVSGYPSDNDDTASFNETADALYLDHAANSVVTIGSLTTTSGFTGSITFSIDLIIDDAGAKNGSLNHKAAATIDVNTSNEQINMDGNLYISSSATFTERSGTLIVQGAGTQELRVQSTNKLYKLTTDTASTVGEIYDNLTAFQVTVGAATEYKCDAATRGYALWHNWTDSASNGLVATSSGTLRWLGDSTNWCNMTTADASPPPTNYWLAFTAAGYSVVAEWATFSYGKYVLTRGAVDIENSTMDHMQSYGYYAYDATTLTAFNNNTISNIGSYGLVSNINLVGINNLVMTNAGSGADIRLPQGNDRIELTNSNFDATRVSLPVSGSSVISDTHNDVANAYKIMATTLSKSTITNDFATGDNIELVSGKFIMDEDGAALTVSTASGTTWQIGKDTADAAITLTFDDHADSGFVNNAVAGNFIMNGTTTYPHTITSASTPPASGNNYWTGWDYDVTTGKIYIHNATFLHSISFGPGRGIVNEISNLTINDSKSGAAALIIYEPPAGAFYNDVTINASQASSGIYIMPGDNDVFFERLYIGNYTGSGNDWTIDEGDTAQIVEFVDSNFWEENLDWHGIGHEGHWISKNHNDTAGRYLVGIYDGYNSSKSYVTNDFTASDTVELLEGVLTIDENADATSFFIEESDAGIEVLSTYTFDLTTNLTNNGTLINNGTITDSGGYFNFYNTNPGGMWFNNSTVSKAKLAYYYGGFNFTVGRDANSTINDWTLEAPSVDTDFNVTFYDFNNKGSGVIWHLNATASSGSVKFVTSNLTSGETYRSFVDLVQHTEGNADSGNYYNFSYNGWSTRHIYLIWGASGPTPDIPGPGQYDSWIVGFKYSKNFFTNEVRFESIAKYDYEPSWFIWEFSDGAVIETASPNITHTFKWGLYTTEDVKLTIIFTDGNRYYAGPGPLILDNTLWVALVCLAVISVASITILHTRRERRKTDLIMVETEGR